MSRVVVIEEQELRRILAEVVREVLPKNEEWIKPADAARRASLDPSTVHRWIKAGKVPSRGKGKRRRVRLEDVLAELGESPPAEEDVTRQAMRILAGGRRT